MSRGRPQPSWAPPAEPRDVHAELLGSSSPIDRERDAAREAWLDALTVPGARDLVLELALLLRATSCFANPRNHPGRGRRHAPGLDFREHVELAREGTLRAVAVARALLGQGEPSFLFQRYLETLLPDDGARSAVVRGLEDTPESSLLALRHTLTAVAEVQGGILRATQVPFRVFFATQSLAQRAVSGSRYFRPDRALAFRADLDSVEHPRLLALVGQLPGDAARRLVALVFLALLRLVRTLDLLERLAASGGLTRGGAYAILAVFRSDARALHGAIRRWAGPHLGAGFEQAVLATPAASIVARHDELQADLVRLLSVRDALDAVASSVRLETRAAFLAELPAPEQRPSMDAVASGVRALVTRLRAPLQRSVLALGDALGKRLDDDGLFGDDATRRALSESLRLDVWLLAELARELSSRLRKPPSDRGWASLSPVDTVRELLAHFDAAGARLLRDEDRATVGPLLQRMRDVARDEAPSSSELERLAHEASARQGELDALFVRIGQREELRGVAFDEARARARLAHYLMP